MKRLLLIALFAGLLASPASARLGETLDQLKARYGKPESGTRKDVYVWLFETEDEKQLMLSVTFNAKGLSIAVGLKPGPYARFSQNSVQAFLDVQLAPYSKSKTLLHPKTGEAYAFAGRNFVCGEHEEVYVDDDHGILIVWNQEAPTLMAVSAAMLN